MVDFRFTIFTRSKKYLLPKSVDSNEPKLIAVIKKRHHHWKLTYLMNKSIDQNGKVDFRETENDIGLQGRQKSLELLVIFRSWGPKDSLKD